ncbi:hypothetical protein FVEN_g842 [Fusarium venenatum]|uniref:Uncharacterized protein n=1 Tax=Fusarium venenatum TaxID=56646 RepID=A0A2L2TVE1_9HYPO|nr:uncharacterized protein FVRRES_10748 [Fusarium venenatum]KAG8361301.1 hypothetical protein FVEN_g842 [Fusarium venenatum]KAH6967327.1 hypothetical protein EDB82DRAFT_481610 [Fusarium venenatum]CEI70671.1 unnamed protein product [Fusarium venenatum]
MTEQSDKVQDPVESHESSADSAADTATDSQPDSPTLGWANAPPPDQAANEPRNLSHNQYRVEIYDFQCLSFTFVKPTTHQQYRYENRITDIKKERLERELFEVRRVLRSFSVSEEEFQAALAEYANIKHDILKLELQFACVKRAWRFVLDERERLMRLGDSE